MGTIFKTEMNQYSMPVRTPARFNELIDTKQFTNSADRETLRSLYAATFKTMCKSQSTLTLAELEWTDDDVIVFTECLPRFTQLARLDLDGNRFGDRGAEALAQALRINST